MTGWAQVRTDDGGDQLGRGEVPKGTPGAVPVRYEVDLLGRRVAVAWTVPAPGAEDHWG